MFLYYQNKDSTENIRSIEGLFNSLETVKLYNQFIIKFLGNI